MKMYYTTPSINKNSDEKKGFVEIGDTRLDYTVANEKPDGYFETISEAISGTTDKPKRGKNVVH